MLAAKVRPPKQARGTLLRSRLVDALQANLERKLQLVVAPAGFGKTTLLVDFIQDAGASPCWATLDFADRDPAVFLATVVEAIRCRFPDFGARTLAALNRPGDIEQRTHGLARVLAAEIEDSIHELAVLVLDDFHEVDGSVPVTRMLDEWLRILPSNLRLVLASRTLPGFTVSRLIVEGQLFGLGEADLRFTSAELLTLLQRRGGPVLDVERARALAEGAEGWIAGFLLSTPQLWEGIVSGLIAGRGSEGPLYDYLASETFDRQPQEVQRFLLATSVLETADLELCTALLGAGNWAAMLEHVERAGLFVVRLTTERGAFRYHQLFRDFLRTRLQRSDPALYVHLQAAAAVQLESRGLWQVALQHRFRAEQPEGAVALMLRVLPELKRTSRWRTLVDAAALLPTEAIASSPSLSLAAANAAVRIGDLPRAEQFAEAARAAGLRSSDGVCEAQALAVLGNVRRNQGRTTEALAILTRALALAPADETLVAAVRRDTGKCLGVQGDLVGAAEQLRQSLLYFERAGDESEAARSEFGLGIALAKSGRLAEAIAHYESALQRCRQVGDVLLETDLLNSLGNANAHKGDYERARSLLQECLGRLRAEGEPITEGATLHSLGEVLLAAGDVDGARRMFEQGLAVTQEVGELWVTTYLYDGLALATAFDGDLRRAEERAHHAMSLAQRQDSPYLVALCRLTLGAILLRAGKPEARAMLQSAASTLAEMGAPREAARSELWLMQAEHAAGDVEASYHHLRTALRMMSDLGSDALLDLHVRWDPAPLVDAAPVVEPGRLRAALARSRISFCPTDIEAPAPLPEFTAAAFGYGTLTMNGVAEVDWAWEKSKELFFLLLHAGPRRQQQLLATLWPDSPATKARTALHTAVYRLRRAAHPLLLVLHDGVYRVDTELLLGYDVREFERCVSEAAGAGPDDALSLLERAVQLYAAPFLEGIDTVWCADERRRLEQRYLLALERLAEVYRVVGRPGDSIAAIEQLLAYDPLREDMHVRLIRAHLRQGDRAAAYAHLQRSIALLHDELGVEPGPELQLLRRRIRG